MPIYTYTTLDDPASTIGITQAFGVNDAGQIVGVYDNSPPSSPPTASS